jgi:DNA-binding MurR/RpiR family transcriptional regulator
MKPKATRRIDDLTQIITSADAQAARPAEILRAMQARAQTMIAELAADKADQLGGVGRVHDEFGIPVSMIRNWKKSGKVIAFRLPGQQDDLFPLVQFAKGAVMPSKRWHFAKRRSEITSNDVTTFDVMDFASRLSHRWVR